MLPRRKSVSARSRSVAVFHDSTRGEVNNIFTTALGLRQSGVAPEWVRWSSLGRRLNNLARADLAAPDGIKTSFCRGCSHGV